MDMPELAKPNSLNVDIQETTQPKAPMCVPTSFPVILDRPEENIHHFH